MAVPRKILIRVIGAPILLAALGVVLYRDYRAGGVTGLRFLLFVAALLSALEFYALSRAKGIVPASLAGVATVGLAFFPWAEIRAQWEMYTSRAMLLELQIPLLLYVLLKLVFRHGRFTPEAAALTFMGAWYAGLLSFLDPAPVSGRAVTFYLLFLVAANKGADMAAYVVGKSMGRHKMTPVLSPNKTWEGFVGGAIGGTATGAAVLLATPLREAYGAVPAAALLCFAFLVTMAAQVGDLVESAIKRWAGVKDSGRLLPEFGGMLDMVDSFLISIPVAHFGSLILFRLFEGA